MKKSNLGNTGAQSSDGRRVERTTQDGRVVDTTYDAEGNVIEVVAWVKGREPAQPGDPRARGPMPNHDGRPL